ncbi:unnamed protein product [Sympodiomycopsis kandeliae]
MTTAIPSETTTKLLTLLNVSATKPGKRKATGPAWSNGPLGGKRTANRYEQVTDEARKALSSVVQDAKEDDIRDSASSLNATASTSALPHITSAADSDDEQDTPKSSGNVDSHPSASVLPRDLFNLHFASEGEGSHISRLANLDLKNLEWEQTVHNEGALGKTVRSTPKGWNKSAPQDEQQQQHTSGPHANVVASWNKMRKSQPPSVLQQRLVPALSTYQDFYHSNLATEDRADVREAVACHAVSHAIKTRRRIMKNNERLAHAAAAGTSENVEVPRDQGFTRPKVLILAPMRNTALEWVHLLERLSGCPQIDNKSRLEKEYNLPEGAVDKLTLPEARERYPADHLDTFRGNIDDTFQLGVKLTRKSLKLFSAFYESDFIIASPLALRLAIEKDRDSDFLSSIEVLVVDQMDVMTMQNWDHLQFVMSHLNKIPKQSHDTDFSRVKHWYLDDRAANLRQSVLLSSLDGPEMRSLYTRTLVNVAGKVRTLQDSSDPTDRGVMGHLREGIRQSFIRFDCANLQAEHDLRFQYFTQKTLPNLLKSGISSSKTLIFIPSYFDFVQLKDYFEQEQLSFVSISEYSTGKEIARARQDFFAGKRSFMLITERFHFYRRYVIRGVQTVCFYNLPQHPQYFTEVVSFPFAKSTSVIQALQQEDGEEGEGETMDPNDVVVQVLYSRYDLMRLQRIVGGKSARRMVEEERSTWRFT